MAFSNQLAMRSSHTLVSIAIFRGTVSSCVEGSSIAAAHVSDQQHLPPLNSSVLWVDPPTIVAEGGEELEENVGGSLAEPKGMGTVVEIPAAHGSVADSGGVPNPTFGVPSGEPHCLSLVEGTNVIPTGEDIAWGNARVGADAIPAPEPNLGGNMGAIGIQTSSKHRRKSSLAKNNEKGGGMQIFKGIFNPKKSKPEKGKQVASTNEIDCPALDVNLGVWNDIDIQQHIGDFMQGLEGPNEDAISDWGLSD